MFRKYVSRCGLDRLLHGSTAVSVSDPALTRNATPPPISLSTSTHHARRFSQEEVSNSGQVKSSVQRAIRSKVLEQYPKLEAVIDDIIPKKGSIVLAKWCVWRGVNTGPA